MPIAPSTRAMAMLPTMDSPLNYHPLAFQPVSYRPMGFYTPQAHQVGVRTFESGEHSAKEGRPHPAEARYFTPTNKPLVSHTGFSTLAEKVISKRPAGSEL